MTMFKKLKYSTLPVVRSAYFADAIFDDSVVSYYQYELVKAIMDDNSGRHQLVITDRTVNAGDVIKNLAFPVTQITLADDYYSINEHINDELAMCHNIIMPMEGLLYLDEESLRYIEDDNYLIIASNTVKNDMPLDFPSAYGDDEYKGYLLDKYTEVLGNEVCWNYEEYRKGTHDDLENLCLIGALKFDGEDIVVNFMPVFQNANEIILY